MLELDNTISRSKSAATRVRPSSVYLASTNGLSYNLAEPPGRSELERDYSTSHKLDRLPSTLTGFLDGGKEPTRISSNVDFLKAMEEEDPTKRKEKRSSSGSKYSKRASMPSISLSGTRSLLSGRFGEAFRRFETSTTNGSSNYDQGAPSSPPIDRRGGGRDLTPIAGSEATDGMSDDGRVVEETEETPPEVRRELERRRLSMEERRVAEGALAYRQSLAQKTGGSGGLDKGSVRGGRDTTNRAASIQNKVQALLDENDKLSPTKKTAEGYGRFTDSPDINPSRRSRPQEISPIKHRKRLESESTSTSQGSSTTASVDRRQRVADHQASSVISSNETRPWQKQAPVTSSSAPPTSAKPFPRPSAPPKPHALRTGTGRGEVVRNLTQSKTISPSPRRDEAEDWEANFSKRYPSLSGLEMVETVIEPKPAAKGGTGTGMGSGSGSGSEGERRGEISIRDV